LLHTAWSCCWPLWDTHPANKRRTESTRPPVTTSEEEECRRLRQFKATRTLEPGARRILSTASNFQMAPAYLAALCLPITASASRRGGLQSATTNNLLIPRCRLSTHGTRAFSVAGPVSRNSLPDCLKSSDLSFSCFRQQLKHFYFVNIHTSTALAH